MGRRKASETREQVYQEYDRLMKEERNNDPIKASYLPRAYYVRKIVLNPNIRASNESYVYQILKMRFKQ